MPSLDTAAILVAKLRKTRAAIAAHTSRGRGLGGRNGSINNRGCGLCDRYDDLRQELHALDYGAWVTYCESLDSDPRHDGHDLFA